MPRSPGGRVGIWIGHPNTTICRHRQSVKRPASADRWRPVGRRCHGRVYPSGIGGQCVPPGVEMRPASGGGGQPAPDRRWRASAAEARRLSRTGMTATSWRAARPRAGSVPPRPRAPDRRWRASAAEARRLSRTGMMAARSGEPPGLGRGACRRGDRFQIGAGAPQRRRPAASPPGLGWRRRPAASPGLDVPTFRVSPLSEAGGRGRHR